MKMNNRKTTSEVHLFNRMHFYKAIAILYLLTFFSGMAQSLPRESTTEHNPLVDSYQETSRKITTAALKDSSAFERLAYLCDTFGSRFSGTESLEQAIDWILQEMKKDGLANVHGEAVMVPRWVRGKESLEMVNPRRKEFKLLGLGGSISTPEEGITAEVLVVRSFDELRACNSAAQGKIVVYNAPFTSYGETVGYRYGGAIEAARAGGVASLIRSVTPVSLNTPHTGGMAYADDVPKIPQAAITVEISEMLQRFHDRGEKVTLRLKMEAETLPDVPSRNVVAELPGRDLPEEIIVIGGHIDSWDVGQGAMDDAGGCVAAWEAVRLLMELGLQPRRTIRVVLWTNEENGTRGGKGYYEVHKNEIEQHVLAIETDGGVFKPDGFGFTGSETTINVLREISRLLDPIEAGEIRESDSGVDIQPLIDAGVPGMGLTVDGTKYFWYHHTAADMIDKLDPHEFNLCVATLAVMAYVVADMPERLPR